MVYLASGGPPLWKYWDGEWLAVNESVPSDPKSADVIHVDHHALAWVGPQHLLVGNDGGVYLKNEVQDLPWLARNDGLAITQFVAGAVHPDDEFGVLGGANDNSVSLLLPPAGPIWKKLSIGDGTGAFFGGSLQHLAFFLQYGIVERSLDGGANSAGALFGIPDAEHGGNWLTRAAHCPADPDQGIYGAFRIWKSTNFFSELNHANIAWEPKSPPMNLTSPVHFVTALAFAPSDASCETYAFADDSGKLSLPTDDGDTWTPLNSGSELPGRIPTALAFSPNSVETLWVTFSGFDAATPGEPGHVFRSDDATSVSPHWTNVSPPVDLPHHTVAVHPADPQIVYVGCDLGAWVTGDNGATWLHNGPSIGMPNVPVMDLHVGACSATAFTMGRSAFRTVSLIGPACLH